MIAVGLDFFPLKPTRKLGDGYIGFKNTGTPIAIPAFDYYPSGRFRDRIGKYIDDELQGGVGLTADDTTDVQATFLNVNRSDREINHIKWLAGNTGHNGGLQIVDNQDWKGGVSRSDSKGDFHG